MRIDCISLVAETGPDSEPADMDHKEEWRAKRRVSWESDGKGPPFCAGTSAGELGKKQEVIPPSP